MLNAQPTASTLIASALVSSPSRQLFASHDLEETCAMANAPSMAGTPSGASTTPACANLSATAELAKRRAKSS